MIVFRGLMVLPMPESSLPRASLVPPPSPPPVNHLTGQLGGNGRWPRPPLQLPNLIGQLACGDFSDDCIRSRPWHIIMSCARVCVCEGICVWLGVCF